MQGQVACTDSSMSALQTNAKAIDGGSAWSSCASKFIFNSIGRQGSRCCVVSLCMMSCLLKNVCSKGQVECNDSKYHYNSMFSGLCLCCICSCSRVFSVSDVWSYFFVHRMLLG